MNLINNLFPENITSAIGWTLLHSLWEGAAVALILGTILILTPKSSSRIRASVSAKALLFYSAIVLFTFLKVYSPESPNIAEAYSLTEIQSNAANISDASLVPITADNSLQNIAGIFQNYFNQHLPLLVSIWFIGLMFFTLKLVGSYTYTQRLKHRGIVEVSDEWQEKIVGFCNKLRVTKTVSLFESVYAKIPMTVGYLKPVILLPLGTISGMPAQHVEAIILHELAHISRFDYLINVLQTITEIIFFYNPAVWWMSNIIREERENNCDDIAVDSCGNRIAYMRALLNVQQSSSAPSLAMPLTGKKNQLLRRINRMAKQDYKHPAKGKFAIASLITMLFMTAALISCTSLNNDQFNSSYEPMDNYERIHGDEFMEDDFDYTEGKRHIRFEEHDDFEEVEYDIYLDDGYIVKILRDGDEVPEDEMDDLRDEFDHKLAKLSRELKGLRSELANLDLDLGDLHEDLADLTEELSEMDVDVHIDFDDDYWKDLEDLTELEELDDLEDEIRWHKRHKLKINFDKESFREEMKELAEELADIHIKINGTDFDFDDEDFEFDFDFDEDDFDDDDYEHGYRHSKKFKRKMKALKREMKDLKYDFKDLDIDIDLSGLRENLANIKIDIPEIDLSELKAELKILKNFLNELEEEMISDGLIEDGDEINIRHKRGRLYLNGEPVPEELETKYKSIYEKYYDDDWEDFTLRNN